MNRLLYHDKIALLITKIVLNKIMQLLFFNMSVCLSLVFGIFWYLIKIAVQSLW